eukprot:CAMPEP_0202420080 /NCGR_PEP_ID=MMETSP1128-20130828/49632_1 /ASSEMBLY_ACC=CAM_ASM_000463 /TAXON_ID=3047 /ORGANISM="Dunaliella tertiolecta, Strain CCMP1320" /LENGTH=258 /DNA_ID=CAMNT_0049028049 /DNA_START=1833 /DNA_END=2610 /DNA_ORIENTATION=+
MTATATSTPTPTPAHPLIVADTAAEFAETPGAGLQAVPEFIPASPIPITARGPGRPSTGGPVEDLTFQGRNAAHGCLLLIREQVEGVHAAFAFNGAHALGHRKHRALRPLLLQQTQEMLAALDVVRQAGGLHPTGNIDCIPKEAKSTVHGAHHSAHHRACMDAHPDVDVAQLRVTRRDGLTLCNCPTPKGKARHCCRVGLWHGVTHVGYTHVRVANCPDLEQIQLFSEGIESGVQSMQHVQHLLQRQHRANVSVAHYV